MHAHSSVASTRFATLAILASLLGHARATPALAVGDTAAPVATIEIASGPHAVATVTFDEDAGPVTPENLLFQRSDGSAIPATRRCTNLLGAEAACSTRIRKVVLDPTGAHPIGDRLTVVVNPSGVGTPATDLAGNPVAETTKVQPLRADQGELGPSLTHSWQPLARSSALGGAARIASSRGMTATFRFRGTRVTWITRTGPSDGRASVRIDGGEPRVVDLSAAETTWRVRRSFGNLSEGPHTIEITALGERGRRGNGKGVVVDAFQDERGYQTEARAAMRWGRVDWSGARGGKIAVTGTRAAPITIRFAGGGADLRLPVGPSLGIAKITVDGSRVGNSDLYAKSSGIRRRTISGLAAGIHTVTIEATGKRNPASRGAAVGFDHVETAAPVDMFSGLGAWIDLFDYTGSTTRSQIRSMLDAMDGHGVETLYLETARYNSDGPFDYPSRIAVWLEEAHARGIEVVGWYFPAYGRYLDVDVSRTVAVATYRSRSGETFDALGVDIEYWHETNGPAHFAAGIVEHLERVRRRVGITYPISSIAPPPNQMELAPSTWAGFPWPAIGRWSDAILPMAYSSYRKGNQCPDIPRYCTKLYTKNAVLRIREATGRPSIPIHVIGGISDRLTEQEFRDFVAGAEAANAFGASMYDHRTTSTAKYRILESFDASPLP